MRVEHMTPEDHYHFAEKYLEEAKRTCDDTQASRLLVTAQVHATLATAPSSSYGVV